MSEIVPSTRCFYWIYSKCYL